MDPAIRVGPVAATASRKKFVMFHTRLLVVAWIDPATPPAFATSGVTHALGNADGSNHVMPSRKSRGDVAKECEAWERHSVTSEGWCGVGDEVGREYVDTPGNMAACRGAVRILYAGVIGGLSRGGRQSVYPTKR